MDVGVKSLTHKLFIITVVNRSPVSFLTTTCAAERSTSGLVFRRIWSSTQNGHYTCDACVSNMVSVCVWWPGRWDWSRVNTVHKASFLLFPCLFDWVDCWAYCNCWIQYLELTPFDAHCCHMGRAIKHTVPDQVKQSFVIFDIRALWRSVLSVGVSGCQKLQMTT